MSVKYWMIWETISFSPITNLGNGRSFIDVSHLRIIERWLKLNCPPETNSTEKKLVIFKFIHVRLYSNYQLT